MAKTIYKRRIKQEGIALVQVLLISTIISLLALRFTFTARDQIKIVEAFEQRVKLSQQLKSIQNKISFTLLTHERNSTEYPLFPDSEPWNYYGSPFLLQDNGQIKVTVALQDMAGLMPQQYVKWPFWRVALQSMGYSDAEISETLGVMSDWQDRNTDSWILGDVEPNTLPNGVPYKNLRIQLQQEIDWLFDGSPEDKALIKQVSMQYPSIGFNFLHAPDKLLHLLLPQDEASEVVRQRESGTLTAQSLRQLLNNRFDEEYLSFYSARDIRMSVKIESVDNELIGTILVKVQPRQTVPLLILERY